MDWVLAVASHMDPGARFSCVSSLVQGKGDTDDR
jgi:hypothetical protein